MGKGSQEAGGHQNVRKPNCGQFLVSADLGVGAARAASMPPPPGPASLPPLMLSPLPLLPRMLPPKLSTFPSRLLLLLLNREARGWGWPKDGWGGASAACSTVDGSRKDCRGVVRAVGAAAGLSSGDKEARGANKKLLGGPCAGGRGEEGAWAGGPAPAPSTGGL